VTFERKWLISIQREIAAVAFIDEDFQSGVTALQAGNLKQAERRLQAVIRSQPKHVPALNLLGIVLARLGRNAEALGIYDQALAFSPDSAESWYGRGMILLTMGRPNEAIASFTRLLALKPDFTQVHLLQAKLLCDTGHYEAALEGIGKLLAIAPGFAEGWLGRSNILFESHRYEEALSAAEKAIALKPGLAEGWHGRGNALNELRRHDEALAAYEKVLALNANSAGGWYGRGNVLNDLKRFEDALVAYDKALALDQNFAQGWVGRGNVLNVLKRFEPALAAFARALALQANLAEAWLGRGNVLLELKRVEEALACYDRAIAIKPDFATAYFNRGRGRLLLGRYEGGWQDYEWRWQARDFLSKRPELKISGWQGENLRGRHLLVYSEQGLGDIIQFVRYLPLLLQRGYKITFLTSEKLARLIRHSIPSLHVIDSLQGLHLLDVQVALISLPYLFKTDLSSVPNQVPYLSAEAKLETAWRARIGTHGFKIGIAWQGNPVGAIETGRSVPLKEFVRLSKIPKLRLISLQKHVGLDQLADLPEGAKIETLGDDFDSGPDAFIDTAAVMNNLDLIITCDTSIAHLAGALGRPAWLALTQVPDWRWMLDREDSPWYPTLRLFRQPQRDDWGCVFSKIEESLHEFLGRRLNGDGFTEGR
jgi:tetratricopeptide (TPR) repeat protein